MPDSVDRIAEAVNSRSDGARLRVGLVTATSATHAQVNITGAAWLPLGNARPSVGDRVWIIMQGPTGVIGGRLSGGDSTPVGAVMAYAGADTALPDGWLLCNGAAVSRTDFPLLFSRLGTTYGGGDGSTTFNLPNLANRFPLGAGSRARAATGGAETVTLTTAQIPGHTHTVPGGAGDTTVASGTGATVGSSVTATSSSTGGGGSHENMPPFLVLYYIIKVA